MSVPDLHLTHLLFPDSADILRLLDAMIAESPQTRLPRELSCTSDGNPVLCFDGSDTATGISQDPDQILHLCNTLGITPQPVARPRLTTVRLADVLQPVWRRIDSVRHHAAGRRKLTHPAADTDSSSDSRTRYVLAAASRSTASRLVKTLTRFLTPDIKVRPVEKQNGSAPYEYLWAIDGDISQAVLNIADRVWYGPLRQRETVHVFCQWPWTTGLSRRFLTRIDWGADMGSVLIGPDAPLHLIVRLDPEVTYAPLTDLSDLQVGSVVTVEQLDAGPEPDVPFPVKVRLVDRPDRRENTARQLQDIERRIEHLHAMQEHLQKTTGTQVGDDFTTEPLFVYFESHREKHLPAELQRLLVEWSDQESDLQNLYYHRIDAASLIPGGNTSGTAHLLTTAAAIGRKAASEESLNTLGYRLSTYRPRGSGRHSSFALLPHWARFGLRLFVPDNQYRWRLKLYPDPPLTKDSARRLAQAMEMPTDNLNKWCAVLLATPDDRVHVCRLRTRPDSKSKPHKSRHTAAAFRPLFDTFRWECLADVDLSTGTAVRRQAGQATDALRESLTRDIETAVEKEIRPALVSLDEDLKQCRDQLAGRRKNLAAIRKVVADITGQHETAVQILSELAENIQQAAAKCSDQHGQLPDDTAPGENSLAAQLENSRTSEQELQKIIDSLQTTTTATIELVSQCESVQKQIRDEIRRSQ